MKLTDLYTAFRHCGSGTFGEVWMAKPRGQEERKDDDGYVALKVSAHVNMVNEFKILQHLTQARCRGVVSVPPPPTPMYRLTSKYCFEMELLGSTLQDHLDAHDVLSERSTARYTLQLFRALWDCHAAGVIHGDLKPQNIVLERNATKKRFRRGRACMKLVDFSNALFYKKHASYNTQSRCNVIYTSRYHARHCRDYAPHDDLESLTYHSLLMLRGRLPWTGIPHRNVFRIMNVRSTAVDAMLENKYTKYPLPKNKHLADFIRGVWCLARDTPPDYAALEALLLKAAAAPRSQRTLPSAEIVACEALCPAPATGQKP